MQRRSHIWTPPRYHRTATVPSDTLEPVEWEVCTSRKEALIQTTCCWMKTSQFSGRHCKTTDFIWYKNVVSLQEGCWTASRTATFLQLKTFGARWHENQKIRDVWANHILYLTKTSRHSSSRSPATGVLTSQMYVDYWENKNGLKMVYFLTSVVSCSFPFYTQCPGFFGIRFVKAISQASVCFDFFLAILIVYYAVQLLEALLNIFHEKKWGGKGVLLLFLSFLLKEIFIFLKADGRSFTWS